MQFQSAHLNGCKQIAIDARDTKHKLALPDLLTPIGTMGTVPTPATDCPPIRTDERAWLEAI